MHTGANRAVAPPYRRITSQPPAPVAPSSPNWADGFVGTLHQLPLNELESMKLLLFSPGCPSQYTTTSAFKRRTNSASPNSPSMAGSSWQQLPHADSPPSILWLRLWVCINIAEFVLNPRINPYRVMLLLSLAILSVPFVSLISLPKGNERKYREDTRIGSLEWRSPSHDDSAENKKDNHPWHKRPSWREP